MQKLLIISSVWVEPNSSAAGSRMLQLIKLFLKEKYTITYISTANKSEFAFDLNKLNINCKSVALNNSSFDDLLLDFNPNIVLFDRFIIEEQFGWRVAEKLPKALRILDTEDLHCLRNTREIALKNNAKFIETDLLKSETAKREIASILRCDLSLIISTFEMRLLERIFKIDKNILHYIPFLLPKLSALEINKTPSFNERKHFYFVGNFFHKPNIDCVLYLKTIWKKISSKLPNVQLHIYGAYLPPKIQQLHNLKEGFVIKGRTENLLKIIKNSKICLAPLRFGAGLKGKFLEAIQNGTPSITTNIGAEAMVTNLEWSGIIANNSDEIINAAIALYTNKNLWLKSQENGIRIINDCYDIDYYSQLLIDKISTTTTNLETHRQQNFIGGILQHHTLKSTKYLSKWIEEKNK